MTEALPTEPRRVVSAIITFFDCAVETKLSIDIAERSVNDGHGEAPAGNRQAPASSPTPMPPRLVVKARALIPRGGWSTYASYGGEGVDVEWRVPGPRGGCFTTYDCWMCEDDEYPLPDGIPYTLNFVADSDYGVADRRWLIGDDGLSPDVVETAVGWGYEERPPWRGQEGAKPFPGIRVQNYGSEPEHGADLPLVLKLGGNDITLNADALGTLVVCMPIAYLQELATKVAQGQGLGLWSGHLLIGRGKCSVIVRSSDLSWWTASRQAVARQQFQHELGLVFRAARSEWKPHLPPVVGNCWRKSQIHTALREALPGIARQSLREGWNDGRREQVFRDALEIVRGARLALSLLDETGSLEQELLAKARNNRGSTSDCWPLYTLGPGGIDPVSMHTLSRQHHGGSMVSLDSLVELSRRYERLPGLRSAGMTRALVHGLLAAETGDYLGRPRPDALNRSFRGDKDWDTPDLTRVTFKADHEEFLDNPKLKALREAQGRQLRRNRRSLLRALVSDCFVWGAIGAGLGVGPGGWIGAVAGFFGGMKIGSILHGRRLLAAERLPVRRLAAAMQSACMDVDNENQEHVSWATVHRRMSKAASLGAVWPPEAWRLVVRARRKEIASRT